MYFLKAFPFVHRVSRQRSRAQRWDVSGAGGVTPRAAFLAPRCFHGGRCLLTSALSFLLILILNKTKTLETFRRLTKCHRSLILYKPQQPDFSFSFLKKCFSPWLLEQFWRIAGFFFFLFKTLLRYNRNKQGSTFNQVSHKTCCWEWIFRPCTKQKALWCMFPLRAFYCFFVS